ncbi:MAG TPA: lipoyl(octanoyl) transferase LipB [Leptolyngbyaceae cyanobacterium]
MSDTQGIGSTCDLYNFTMVPYETALEWQRALVQYKKMASHPDVLLLLEHPPVYTLGQGSDLKFVKFDPSQNEHAIHRTERGGEVTYHCPGQLVGYPILNLQALRPDLHWYLRQLEEVLIQALMEFGLAGKRVPGLTGVWLDGHKVAAIGIKVSRWITMHGFALNVCPDLTGFQRIVPCGIADKPVASLEQFCPGITVEQVRPVVAAAFERVFDLRLQPQPVHHLELVLNSIPSI